MAANPFNDAAYNVSGTVPAASGAWDGAAWSGKAGVGAGGGGDLYAAPAPLTADLEGPARALARREAELDRREAELHRLEVELRESPELRSKRNWPRGCPVVRHDIAEDIPPHAQRMVRFGYWAYLGLLVCLFFNLLGPLAALIATGGDYLGSFLWAAIYLCASTPIAFFSWYMRLYVAGQRDGVIAFSIFFACFSGHLVFCVWSALGPPLLNSKSHTGWMSAVSMLGVDTGAGVMYFIGASLWTVESLWSLVALQTAYAFFRGGRQAALPIGGVPIRVGGLSAAV